MKVTQMIRSLVVAGFAAGLMSGSAAQAVTFGVEDANGDWLHWITVSDLATGTVLFGFQASANPNFRAEFDVNGSNTLTLGPNNNTNPTWYDDGGDGTVDPGDPGNKLIEALSYFEFNQGELNGQMLTFEGTVLSNSLTAAHTAEAYIKDSTGDVLVTVPLTPGPFSVSLDIPDYGIGVGTVKFGLRVIGENVQFVDRDPFGTVVLETASASLPGDLDGDGFVGITDLNIVLGNWNQNVAAGDPLVGDPSGDGFVGIEDLNTVLGNWNAGTPPTAGAAVPEPATLALLGLGSAVVMGRRRS